MNCSNLNVFNSEIYQCSSGACWFFRCRTVRVDKCNVHDIGGASYYADYFCTDVLVDGNPILDDLTQ